MDAKWVQGKMQNRPDFLYDDSRSKKKKRNKEREREAGRDKRRQKVWIVNFIYGQTLAASETERTRVSF